jgi:hypothetical protein
LLISEQGLSSLEMGFSEVGERTDVNMKIKKVKLHGKIEKREKGRNLR